MWNVVGLFKLFDQTKAKTLHPFALQFLHFATSLWLIESVSVGKIGSKVFWSQLLNAQLLVKSELTPRQPQIYGALWSLECFLPPQAAQMTPNISNQLFNNCEEMVSGLKLNDVKQWKFSMRKWEDSVQVQLTVCV